MCYLHGKRDFAAFQLSLYLLGGLQSQLQPPSWISRSLSFSNLRLKYREKLFLFFPLAQFTRAGASKWLGKNEKYRDSISNIAILVCKAHNSESITTECTTLHSVWSQVQAPIVFRKLPHILALISWPSHPCGYNDHNAYHLGKVL